MTNTIYATTGTLAEIAGRVGLVQQSLSGTGDVNREVLVGELQGVLDSLYGLVDFATEAQAERERRENATQTPACDLCGRHWETRLLDTHHWKCPNCGAPIDRNPRTDTDGPF